MKNKKAFKITIIICIITIISIIAVAATYAGYAGIIAQSSDTAYIARWDIKLNSVDNLFNHDYIVNLRNKDENGKYIIAPGVSGKYDIVLTNSGDVKAKVTKIVVSKADTTLNIPLKFSIDEKQSWTTLENNAVLNLDDNIISVGESKKIVTLYWEWPSEGNDVIDTLVGVSSANGNKTYSLDVNISAEQFIDE